MGKKKKKKSLKQKQNWLISLLPKPRKPLSVNKQQTSWRKGGVTIPFHANRQIHKLVWAGPSSSYSQHADPRETADATATFPAAQVPLEARDISGASDSQSTEGS